MANDDDSFLPKGYLAIIEKLRKELDGGKYKPGEKLPSEKELCSRFGASRSTVREALAALAYVGAVEVRGGSGYYVVGNLTALFKDSSARCAAKFVATVDGAWTVAAVKRLLAAGADGIILRAADNGQWSKQLRAVRQAANDLGITLPILAEVPPGADAESRINLAISANIDAIVVWPAEGTEELLAARRIIEEQGVVMAIFAWLGTPADNDDILRAADGAIIDFPFSSGAARDALTSIMRQGAATGKLMLLAAKFTELHGSGESCRELAALADAWQFDGVAIAAGGANLDHLANNIQLLRLKAKEIEDHNVPRHKQSLGKIVASPLADALCSTALHAAATVKAAAFIIPSETGFFTAAAVQIPVRGAGAGSNTRHPYRPPVETCLGGLAAAGAADGAQG